MDTQVVELPIPLTEYVIAPLPTLEPVAAPAATPATVAMPVATTPEPVAPAPAPPAEGIRAAEVIWGGTLGGAMFVGAALEPLVPLFDRLFGIRHDR